MIVAVTVVFVYGYNHRHKDPINPPIPLTKQVPLGGGEFWIDSENRSGCASDKNDGRSKGCEDVQDGRGPWKSWQPIRGFKVIDFPMTVTKM
jgi:hypothetical protein